ncbi:MAG: AmmeMemoRadiSam system protein B [Candidatus Krumholzibacteriota bacterium]
MSRKLFWISSVIVLTLAAAGAVSHSHQPRSVPEGKQGGSDPLIRQPLDSVGYATSPDEVEFILQTAAGYTSPIAGGAGKEEGLPEGVMTGAICPHDDYLYAGPAYVEVMKRVKAPVTVIFGVCHAARRRGIQEKLIFDSYDAWKGPYGNCPVSTLRDEIIDALPQQYVMISNELHAREHSIEAFIPFLQYPGFAAGEGEEQRRGIVPVLVTRFPGKKQGKAAGLMAEVLRDRMEARGWTLGEDLAILISADCVHYGDYKWGGRNYAPFGTGMSGYRRALEQELEIIDSSLTGAVDTDKLDRFRELVERDDPEWPYRVTWCGVYSIPFGLRTLSKLSALCGRPGPEGYLLQYSTSLEKPHYSDITGGLGVTNISTLRHWVGYAAIGYW